MKLHMIDRGILYGSANPQKGDKSGYMPALCELENGSILASNVIGSYFDAPDAETRLLRSTDHGKTFCLSGHAPFDFSELEKRFHAPVTGNMKISTDGGGHVLAMGYGFVLNQGAGVGPANVETNGLLDCPAFFTESFDGGQTFAPCKYIDSHWGCHTEASAPVYVLANGDYITPIAAMQNWEGRFTAPMCGRLLRSNDKGKTWDDHAITMDFGADTTVWEQRLAITDSGIIVDIAWVENLKTGELFHNQAAISTDNGKTFSSPIDTGILGQAPGICSLGGEKILTMHSMRKHVDRFGVQACVVDLSGKSWDVEHTEYIWEPEFSVEKTSGNLSVFDMLRFGQPSAIRLRDETILYTQWLMENDVCRTIWIRFALEE